MPMPPTHKKSSVGEKIARTPGAVSGASVAVAFGAAFFAFSNRRAMPHPTRPHSLTTRKRLEEVSHSLARSPPRIVPASATVHRSARRHKTELWNCGERLASHTDANAQLFDYLEVFYKPATLALAYA